MTPYDATNLDQASGNNLLNAFNAQRLDTFMVTMTKSISK